MPHKRMWIATSKMYNEIKRNSALPPSQRSIELPPKEWKHKVVEGTSFSLIACELTLDMGKKSSRNVKVNASVTKCQYFPMDGSYGLRINVRHWEPDGVQNRRRLVRCGLMTITVSISSQDSSCRKRTAILSMAPERSSHSKSEAKYSIKATAKATPSAGGIKVGEVGVEVGREATRSEFARMKGLLTHGGDAAWSLVENKSSKSGVADCEVGIVFIPPSQHVTIKLDIKATYVVDVHFKVIPWTVMREKDMTGSLAIDLAEVVQRIPTLNTTQQGFLEPCSPLVAKEVS
ncbi:hypothetical protein BJ165DRAFT_1508765 [Panaeolus papilionaceus]|nr:hypothetical protein BJ165DRAFT_1508765 [Panaeolus papilionaceus]